MEWLVSLYDVGAPELMNVNALMQEMQYRFEDRTETCQAEDRIRSIWQGKRPVVEYIREFCSLVVHLKGWPEPLVVYQFWDGLNCEMYHNCLPRGVPNVELDLMDYWQQAAYESCPQQVAERHTVAHRGKGGVPPVPNEKPC